MTIEFFYVDNSGDQFLFMIAIYGLCCHASNTRSRIGCNINFQMSRSSRQVCVFLTTFDIDFFGEKKNVTFYFMIILLQMVPTSRGHQRLVIPSIIQFEPSSSSRPPNLTTDFDSTSTFLFFFHVHMNVHVIEWIRSVGGSTPHVIFPTNENHQISSSVESSKFLLLK